MTTLPTTMNPLAPVTPPPEEQTFLKPSLPLSSPKPTCKAADPTLPPPGLNVQPQPQPQPQHAAPYMSAAQYQAGAQIHPPLDPRSLAIVTQIANYYQQRSYAIASFQAQRYQQALAMNIKQRREFAARAGMLCVAWLVRSKLRRRRRRRMSKFKDGLRERQALQRSITRGEGVRRWVMKVPKTVLPDSTGPSDPSQRMDLDKDEAGFSMDNFVALDEDKRLLEMADNAIQTLRTKVVPEPILEMLKHLKEEDWEEGGDGKSEPEVPGNQEESEESADEARDDMDAHGELEEDENDEDDDDDSHEDDIEDALSVMRDLTRQATGARVPGLPVIAWS